MMEQPSFGKSLVRLLRHRRLDVGVLSRTALVPELELQELLGGAAPNPFLLRRLAPALNLHTADLLVMAALPVPGDLTPVDAISGSMITELVRVAIPLQVEQRCRLRRLVQALPQLDRIESTSVLPVYEQYKPGFGAAIVRMLRNRNLDWLSSAQILYRVAGVGPLSAATIGAIGHGRKELSPELLAGFAAVLAIPAEDLAAIVGIELVPVSAQPHAVMAEIAELIWDIRCLTADQVRHVCEVAKRDVVG